MSVAPWPLPEGAILPASFPELAAPDPATADGWYRALVPLGDAIRSRWCGHSEHRPAGPARIWNVDADDLGHGYSRW